MSCAITLVLRYSQLQRNWENKCMSVPSGAAQTKMTKRRFKEVCMYSCNHKAMYTEHTPSTTTLNNWFCQAFPCFGGSGVLLSLHPTPFLCVHLILQVCLFNLKLPLPLSIIIDPLSSQQLAIQCCTPGIIAYDMPVDIPVREGLEMAYQRSIYNVPSSGCLNSQTRCECYDTRSVQALRTAYDGKPQLFRHHQDELQE
jgi:hypothetical protein